MKIKEIDLLPDPSITAHNLANQMVEKNIFSMTNDELFEERKKAKQRATMAVNFAKGLFEDVPMIDYLKEIINEIEDL